MPAGLAPPRPLARRLLPPEPTFQTVLLNKDVFLLQLTQEIENKISRDYVTKIDIQFYKKNKEICRIKVNTGNDAIWVKKNKTDFTFYIRTQNSTRALSPKDAAEYIRKKWPYSK